MLQAVIFIVVLELLHGVFERIFNKWMVGDKDQVLIWKN